MDVWFCWYPHSNPYNVSFESATVDVLLKDLLLFVLVYVIVGQRLKTFNTQNQQGDTSLHLLCNVRNMLPSVRRLTQEARCNVKIRWESENWKGLFDLYIQFIQTGCVESFESYIDTSLELDGLK